MSKCDNCSEEKEILLTVCGGENWCKECIEENKLEQCDYCSDWSKDSLTTIFNGDNLCERCTDKKTSTCDGCEEIVYNNNIREINSAFICDDCVASNYTKCRGCHALILNDRLCFCEIDDEYYCEECFSEYFGYCEECNCLYLTEDLHNGLCNECDNGCPEGIESYDYEPSSFTFQMTNKEKTTPDNKRLFFGVEVEVERNNCGDGDIEKEVGNLPSFCYAKEDGSLEEGFEIVSEPMSWDWLQEHKTDWNNILRIRNRGFQSYNTTTCGLHIHMSKSAFTTLHLYKFLKLFFENPEFILIISQRQRNALERWASLTCDSSLVYKAKTKHGREKYVAVNTCNPGTIEIRIFRGTLAEAGFWKDFEFCKAVFDFTKVSGIKEITPVKFMDYVTENKKMFPNLYQFLQRKLFITDAVTINEDEEQ